MHCNCLISLTGILDKINIIATLPSRLLQDESSIAQHSKGSMLCMERP